MKPSQAAVEPPGSDLIIRQDHDPKLRPWLSASNEVQGSILLGRLLQDVAKPILEQVVRRKLGPGFQEREGEDIVADALLQIMRRLEHLRQEPPGTKRPLGDFPAYVASVGFTAWAQTVRRRHPARAALVDQLRYLLNGRTNQRGFALWRNGAGERWVGFEAWRERKPFTGSGSEKTARLLADPGQVTREIFGADSVPNSLPLPEILGSLFAWLGEPMRLRDLVDVVAQWRGLAGGGTGILAADGDEEFVSDVAAAGPSPQDELRWKEYLGWLLGEAGRLTLPQRTAFLLHSSCLHEMERLGLTGIRHAASLLGLPPEAMARYWPGLPLEDRVIGTILSLAVQNVINLRKVARGILGRAWQTYLHGN